MNHPLLIDSAQFDLDPDTELAVRFPVVVTSLRTLLKKLDPDVVCAERYIIRRGGGRGNSSEYINHFVGCLLTLCHQKHIPVVLVMASQHKTWCKRRWGCDTHEKWRDRYQLNEHQADSLNIASWCYATL